MKIICNFLKVCVLFCLALAPGISSQASTLNVAGSDILLHIVTQCIDSSKKNYCNNCMFPRADAGCGDIPECKKTNEVWALNAKYVAIRDLSMCGCPAGFFHGLAMPRNPVTGIEDVNREEGIWNFAWDQSSKSVETETLALLVNPRGERTQNQLHVHMLRLKDGASKDFATYSRAYVHNLDEVWRISQQLADSQGLSDYGILVAKESSGTFVIVVTPHSPEGAFTVWGCAN